MSPRTSQHPRPRWITRRTGAAIVTAATIAAAWTVLPIRDAGAAGSRSVSVSISCASTSLTIGTPTTCTVKVDDNASGTKSVPDGTIALTVSSPSGLVGSVVPLGVCTLASVSSRASECSVSVLPLGEGSPVLRAAFTPTDADPHQAGSRTRNLTVSAPNDPVVYAPIFDGSRAGSGTAGGAVSLYLAACPTGASQQFSVFVSSTGDPSSASDRTRPWSQVVDKWGAVKLEASLAADHPAGTFRARFTCSDGAPSTPSSNNVDWTSSTYTYSVSAAAQSGSRLQSVVAAPSSAGASPAATPTAAGTWSVDPESLPLVDRLGIPGGQAAQLKAQVDALRPVAGTVGRLSWAALGRSPIRSHYDRWVPVVASKGTWGLERELERTPEFVATFGFATDELFAQRAYERTQGRWPTAAERAVVLQRLRVDRAPRIRVLAELAETATHRARVAVRDDVVAAYLALTPVLPSPGDLARFESMQRAVVLRVQVIESIALTRAPAERWVASLAAPGARPRF